MRLVLASNNAKKLLELRALFGGLAVDFVGQGELGIGELVAAQRLALQLTA